MICKPSRYLHIICARCGAYNDMIDFTINIPPIEEGENPSVTYHCQNCGTLDDLTNAIEERQEEEQ